MVPSVRPAPRSTLVGRDRELADLFGLLRATADGVGGCVVLTGPPGIGKTRMLTEVQRHALVLGLAVAPGRASELDRLAPLTSLLSAVRAAVPRPVDLSALRDHDGDRLWYVDRLGEALEEYVTGGPLLVVVDDAHWADELSALALRVLVPRLASTPLRWLLARWVAPPESVGHAAIDRLVEEGADQIHLGPLDEDAVHLLCANVLDAAPDATVLSLAAQGRGNPFLLEQFLTALKDTGQIHISDGIASVIGSELPSGLPSAVEQRLRGLSGEARALLRAGSIFQRAFTVHEAARLLGLPATRL
ncbi:MAG: ATP-binding protein, partial [Actinobacteria bacterium]